MRAARMPLLFLVCCLAVAFVSIVSGSDTKGPVVVDSVPPELLGPWHTTGLHGDLLFLIIREIGIDLNEDTTFTAWVIMHDGRRYELEGTYTVEGQDLTFRTNNDKRHGRVHYEFKMDGDRQKSLVLHDPHFGVTADLSRKQ